MKYVFLHLTELNGEREYDHRSVHEMEDSVNSIDFAFEYAASFYPFCSSEEAPDGGYYFSGGEVWVGLGDVREISKEDYDTLKKYLS